MYTALYALVGTTYGGDGVTTFKLPDLQGRVPIGQGQGPGLPYYTLGEAAGNVSATMLAGNMPMHMHTLVSARAQIKVNGGLGDSNTSVNAFFGNNNTIGVYSESVPGNSYMNAAVTAVSGSTDAAGSGIPFSIVNPYLVLNYSIATEGLFPSRN